MSKLYNVRYCKLVIDVSKNLIISIVIKKQISAIPEIAIEPIANQDTEHSNAHIIDSFGEENTHVQGFKHDFY